MMVFLRLVIWAALLLIPDVVFAEDSNLLPNGDFSEGLSGWVLRPGEQNQVKIEEEVEPQKQVLHLYPQGKTLGLESEPLQLGKELEAGQPYQVEAHIKHEGLTQGVFAFSVCCLDENGQRLKQHSLYSQNTRSAPHGWRRVKAALGPGTSYPFPEGTQSLTVRCSFYEPNGNCRGKVFVDDIRWEPLQIPGNGNWPAEIVANVGDLQVRFESRSFWTLYRIDHRGVRVCKDRFGSHYGSVVRFPEIGFIGSGHTENEDEEVLSLQLTVDGKPVEKPSTEITCNQIELLKTSRIKTLILKTRVSVENNQIVEEVRLTAEQATPVSLIYHFMHPWEPEATDYLGVLFNQQEVSGQFDGDGHQEIDQPTEWSVIWNPEIQRVAMTYVAAAPQDHWRTRYWDKDGVYRKHYFTTFLDQTVPADQEFLYRIITIPAEATAENWKEVAQKLAASCEPSKEQ